MTNLIDGVLLSVGLPQVNDDTPAAKPLTRDEQIRELEIARSRVQDRSVDQMVGDAVTTAFSNAVGLGGSAASILASATGAGLQYIGPENSDIQKLGELLSLVGPATAVASSDVVEGINSYRSEERQLTSELTGAISQLKQERNAEQEMIDIANGDSAFIAGLTRFGRDVLDTTDTILSDSSATSEVIEGAFGSLGPSALVAKTGVKLATGAAIKMGVTSGATAIVETIGSAVGTGVIEATGTYSSTVDAVMSRTPEELSRSPLYNELISQGVPEYEARSRVADAAGQEAFILQLPAAMAVGLVAAKFNANPLTAFEGKSFFEGLIQIGAETFEEAAQGGTGQLNQNLAIRNVVDPEQDLIEGVGNQVASGAIGGAGVAGILGAGPTVINTLREQDELVKSQVAYERFVQGMGEQIAAQRRADALARMTPQEREDALRSNMNDTSPAEELFSSVTGRVREAAQSLSEKVSESGVLSSAVDTIKTGVQAAKAAAEPLVNKAIKAAQDYVESPNPVIQSEVVAAAESVSVAAKDPAVETGNIGVSDPSVKADTIPEVFKDSVPEGASLADTMTGIVRTLSEKKIPISDMKDDAILFVAQKFNEMQNAASTLSGNVRENIKKVLSSPDLERIRKRAARIDLNTAISPVIQKVSSTVKNMTVAMSKLNPTNVNPDVVDRILKQEDSDYTPEELRLLEVAASVSRPLNAYKENIVKIADDKYNALVATGQKVQKPENNVDQVSRNLIVGNLTGENKVPSINELANRVIIGMQSPDQAVEIDGVRVPVKEVALNMRNLVQHMANKVNALNESFDKNDDKGVGPSIMHDTLVRGKDFIKAGMAGSHSVTYNRRSPNSVAFAKTVGADAQVLAEVYNALAQAFPEQFPDGPFVMPVVKTVEAIQKPQMTEKSETVSEITTNGEVYSKEDQKSIIFSLEDAFEEEVSKGVEGNIGGVSTELYGFSPIKEGALAFLNGDTSPRTNTGSRALDILIAHGFYQAKKEAKRLGYVPVSAQNTTAVEEVFAGAKTDENAETTPEGTLVYNGKYPKGYKTTSYEVKWDGPIQVVTFENVINRITGFTINGGTIDLRTENDSFYKIEMSENEGLSVTVYSKKKSDGTRAAVLFDHAATKPYVSGEGIDVFNDGGHALSELTKINVPQALVNEILKLNEKIKTSKESKTVLSFDFAYAAFGVDLYTLAVAKDEYNATQPYGKNSNPAELANRKDMVEGLQRIQKNKPKKSDEREEDLQEIQIVGRKLTEDEISRTRAVLEAFSYVQGIPDRIFKQIQILHMDPEKIPGMDKFNYGRFNIVDGKPVIYVTDRFLQDTLTDSEDALKKSTHMVYHELAHAIDMFYRNIDANSDWSMDSRFEEGGVFWKEMEAGMKANPVFAKYMERYALRKRNDRYFTRIEIFAELMALYLYTPATIEIMLPKISAHFKTILDDVFGESRVTEEGKPNVFKNTELEGSTGTDTGSNETDPNTKTETTEEVNGIYISDGNGKPLVFYHGTKNQFINFNGNEIFLTTQRGLAKTHAMRAGSKGTPRLIAAHVTVENPLTVELEGNVELDIYWLNNALTLKSDMAAGNHDSILLINEEGDAMVIATDDSQITQIEDPIKDRVFGAKAKDQDKDKTSERFKRVFQTKKSPTKLESAEAALDAISEKSGTRIYVEFVHELLPRIYAAMNQRVASLKRLEGNTKTLADGLKEDQAAVLEIRDFKPLMIVDPETGTYDQRLLDLASLAVIDWMTTARVYGADRLDDLLKELELDRNHLSDQQIFDLQNTIPPRSTTEGLARKIIKMWNVRVNTEAEMVDIRGTTEGLVKEIFTVLSQMENPLIKIVEVEVGKGRAASFDISALAPEQEAIGLGAVGSLDKVFFPEDQIQASFGEKLTHVPTHQNNKPDVKLSAMERAAVKNMQDTAHLPAEPVINFFQALGLDAWGRMAGRRDSSKLAAKHPLRFSIEGKNSSIERDFTSAFQMVDAAAGRPVFYPVGVTNVGRHQMKGINPQNNKVLRALITPTHSKLDMANNQAHKDGFWLTVAQSSGLAKVEKKDHKLILSTIQQDFNAKFGEATAIALSYLETGTLDSEAFAEAMLKATKEEDVSVAQVNAVLAVARLQQAQRKNDPSHLENFETSLSFELDGKTDGPANMMVAFGQGLMTRAEFMNFKRVGLFLGSKNETLNTFLSGNQDLYEVNSVFSTKRMMKMINEAKGRDKERLIALQRFAAHFGDFQISEDGSIIMSRATSKNPMTKKVYGSGEKGIAEGISQDMLIEFYTKLIEMPEGASIESHMGYLEIRKDLELLFGVVLPKTINPTQYILPPESMAPFAELVKQTIGVVLSSSIEEVMDLKTIGVNNLLVYTTNVQGKFMELFFDQRLAEAMEELKEEFGEGDNQKKGKPTLRKMSQAAYDAIVKETMAFAPVFRDENQTLRIGDFTGQVSNTEMSSNLSGNIRPKSTMARPDNIGVKVIPYVIQGRGDAMMMNRIFGAENAPKKAIPIFDGIDMAITDFMDLSNQVNEAVLDNWDNDVIGPIVTNFEAFMERVKSSGLEDILSMAFDQVKKQSKEKTTVVAVTPSDLVESLREAHRLSMARKAVFKEIPLSVDHMGGSGQAFVRNPDGKELTYEEVNMKIQQKLDNVPDVVDPVEDTSEEAESTLVVTDVQTVVQALIRETKKSHLRDVIRAIRGMLPNDAQIIMGTKEEIQKWRSENLNQNPTKKLDQSTNGFYDIDNNIIFITSDNAETIVHEMIHMATFQAVLDHYNGVRKTAAVKNLEVLMDEFLSMDTSGMPTEALRAYTSAKAAILKGKAEATPMGDAMALNEFMAWTLANDHLMKELKQTPTSLVQRMTKVAKAWIQRILGVVPIDMYGQILFNTEMIRNEEFPGGFETLDEEELTQEANTFTNFWIDLLRSRLAYAKDVAGLDVIATTKKQVIQQKLGKAFGDASDALKQLDFGGFALNEIQKHTFRAIYMVISTELRLDTNALVALGKMYEHITNNLTPAMFGSGQNAQDRYSTVMELFGATTNDEGISDAIAVLLALSQTSSGFRKAMEQIPTPEAQPGVQFTSLNDVLTSTTGLLMQKMIAATDTEGKGVKEILDALSDQIIRQDDQNEFSALRGLMNSFTKADAFVNGAMSKLAQRTNEINKEIQNSTANGLAKIVAGAVTLATNFLDADLSRQQAKGAKVATHMDGMLDGAVFIRELVTEIVGADEINADVIQMLDKVNYVVQSTRQAYREELPVILQNEFVNHPDAKGWKAFHTILGKLDFAALFDLKNPDESFDLLNDQNLLNARIARTEKKILKEFPGQTGKNILIKSQQLADFMNGKGAGFQLWKNAYAIHKLAGGKKPNQVATINRLISLYALNGSDVEQREYVARMQASDPKGVHNLIVYMQALNKEEDQKTISEAARMNGYKGYIPNHPKGEISLIIAKDTDREDWERKGYTRVADDTTDTGSMVSRGYYMSTVKRGGNYSQGVLQQVQDTYRGVNSVTGLTVNGTVSGVISGVAVISITNALNNVLRVNDPKNALIPVMDENGGVLYYERAMNPDLMEKYLEPPANMALMLGAWAGRQVEEKFSHEYNKALVARLKQIWDTRDSGSDGMFVRMDEAKDKIYAESWAVIPPQLKEHIISVFGEETGFMVRKDMINLALGYRDPSIVDVWTGNNRLPEGVELAVKVVGKMFMGDKAYAWMANTETAVMNTVSTAKDVIVVRSLVIPMMNIQSNVFQLVNLGIGTKKIMKGYREKFIEIDKLNENLKKIMGLEAQVKLAATNKNRVAILRQQIQVLKDENKRFSVAPLVEAGAYKTISEGLTELDVSITDGKFGDWLESKLNKLPAGVQTVAKYGLLSKDTALYKGANKATQYGDFVAKSIYYDTLIEQGVSSEKALSMVNEEFVNYSILPGRMRTGLEAIGATWFLAYKIRSMKTALKMMRDNPVRSLTAVGVLGLSDGPVTDNFIAKAAEGTLPYSLGWDMLWDTPAINPWVSLTNG